MRNLQEPIPPRHPGQDTPMAKCRHNWRKKTNPDRPVRRDSRRA
jgi:hypothetical protein